MQVELLVVLAPSQEYRQVLLTPPLPYPDKYHPPDRPQVKLTALLIVLYGCGLQLVVVYLL